VYSTPRALCTCPLRNLSAGQKRKQRGAHARSASWYRAEISLTFCLRLSATGAILPLVPQASAGLVLKRPIGSNGPFTENAKLPNELPVEKQGEAGKAAQRTTSLED
jgi:hypothetical protein